MQTAPSSDIGDRSKPSFKAKFKAWWEGDILPTASASGAPVPTKSLPKAVPAMDAPPPPLLDRPAIKVAQQLWGEGFTQPGGADFVLGMVRPFALNNSMTVMDFGADLGGGTRAVAREFDLWVEGFESDAETAEAAQQLSAKTGVKRAEIKACKPQGFQPKAAGYDCIFSHAALHRLTEKEQLLTGFEQALKTRGHCTITDFVRAPGVAADDPRLKDFAAKPGEVHDFWCDEDYLKQFKALKFDIRVNEDQTPSYRAKIIDAWVSFTSDADGLACARAHSAEAVAEVALWTRRVAMLDSGALQLRRYYGIKMGSVRIE